VALLQPLLAASPPFGGRPGGALRGDDTNHPTGIDNLLRQVSSMS
jgi:hypothetical protein